MAFSICVIGVLMDLLIKIDTKTDEITRITAILISNIMERREWADVSSDTSSTIEEIRI
jgi:hypothetical protein